MQMEVFHHFVKTYSEFIAYKVDMPLAKNGLPIVKFYDITRHEDSKNIHYMKGLLLQLEK